VKDVVDLKARESFHFALPDEETTKRVFDEVAESIDFAIVGAAFCGSCTTYCAKALVELTKRHIPAVGVTNSHFESLAKAVSRAEGLANVNWLVLPSNVNTLSGEEFDTLSQEKLQDIQTYLHGKASSAEKRETKGSKPTSEIIRCKDSIDLIYEQFYKDGLTDGLPIIPPTRERVAAMMSTVDSTFDEMAACLPPRLANVTLEKLAVNAVMAGCQPSYFPVIVAAVEAMLDPKFNLMGHQTSTSPTAIMLMINGPIRHELDINCSWGCFGPGWRANATIGRAISLIMLNIGGRIPGEISKSVFANPGRYTMCIGEREEASPWEPFHVERGFQADQSTVTVICADGYLGLEAFEETTPDQLLENLACQLHLPLVLSTYPAWGQGDMLILMCPDYGRILSEGGYTKQQVQEYFFEHTQDIPSSLIPDWIFQEMIRRDNDMSKFYASRSELIKQGLVKPGQRQVTSKGVSAVARPDQYKIAIAGGDGHINGILITSWGRSYMVTRPIKKAT